MKVNNHHEVLLLSIIFISLGIGILTAVQVLDPNYYNEITGKATDVGTTVNITPTTPQPCDFTLQQGFNLISLFCIGDFYEVDLAFNETTSLTGVWDYRKGSSDPWRVYNPNLPSWVVLDLNDLSKKKGYWVKMSASENLQIQGYVATSASIDVTPGYNLVGYPKTTAESVNTTFNTINGSFNKVVGFIPTSQTYEVYVPGTGGTMNETRQYRGYWINATASDTWVVS